MLIRLLIGFSIVMGIACGDSDEGPPPAEDAAVDTNAPDAGDANPRDVDVPDVEDEVRDYIIENNVAILEMRDGVEYGATASADDGFARFYSPERNALVEFEMDTEEEGVVAGMNVILALSDSGEAVYSAIDPSGEYEPTLHSVMVPETGEHEMTVNNGDSEVRNQLELDYDPETAENPFEDAAEKSDEIGGSSQPLLVGLAVSFVIRSIVISIVVGTVASIFRNLVEGACNIAAPLYAERCVMIGKIAEFGIKLVAGLRIGGINSWGSFGMFVLDEALGNCEDIGAALIGVNTTVTPLDRTPDRELLYRQAAQKWNYLLHAMETDPQEGQHSWDWAAEQSAHLAQLRHGAQERYLVPMNVDEPEAEPGFLMALLKRSVEQFVTNLDATVITAVKDADYGPAAPARYYYDWSLEPMQTTRVIRYNYTVQPTRLWEASTERIKRAYDAFNCAATFVSQVYSEVQLAGSAENRTFEIHDVIDVALIAINAGIEEEYKRLWGADIPMGECLADIMEPNHTWRLAHGSPVPGSLDGGVTTLERLNLCDGLGMTGNDTDWYAYNNPAIDFRVQARFFQPDGAAGTDEEVCMRIHYYSEIYELAGTPPDVLRSACGVGDFATDEFGVRRTAGERWSQIMIEVFPRNPETAGPVDYALRFN